MSEKKPVLEVRNLSVALPAGADRAHAVEKVSFTVNPGEIVCLVGESGSGKSVIAFTVMGLLAKALKPTEGEILLEGENILAAGETRLRELRCTRMSMIFQEPMTALNPVMTCGQQIDEVLETHTKLDAAERKARIIAILSRVKLPEPERIYASYPHQLSGGQRQRIMIAMALVLDPVLLIADEPTTALDVTVQSGILKLLEEKRGNQKKFEYIGSDRVMLVRQRRSRIFYLRKFFDYPIRLTTDTIRKLGLVKVARIGLSYARSVLRPIRPEQTLEQFFINRFGRRGTYPGLGGEGQICLTIYGVQVDSRTGEE
jgi:ABC-type microcin C transport system duplicated ATPase subunit YejF